MGLPDFPEVRLSILSPSLWNLPGLEHILAGSALSSALELGIREAPRPYLGLGHRFLPARAAFPELCRPVVQFQL